MHIFYKKRRVPNIIEVLDWMIAFIMVIAPAFQHYQGPFVNAGWTLWLAALVLIAFNMILKNRKTVWFSRPSLIALIIIIVYKLYHLLDHGFNIGSMFTALLFIILFYYIAIDQLNFKAFIRIVTLIAVVNVACLLLQYICYYVFHYNLQFVDLTKLVDQDYRWVNRLSTTSTNLALYRPSGLFLEPSHVFLFSFPLVLYLFMNSSTGKNEKIAAWLILAGIVLSTSGMGVLFAIGMPIAYFVMFRKPRYKKGSLLNFFAPKTLLIFIACSLLLWILFLKVDIVQQSLLRVFATDSEGYNAFSGRTSKGVALLNTMSGKQIIIGIADEMGELGKAVSGFQGEMFKYGVIGIVISYCYYLCMLNSREYYTKYLAFILIVISFVCGHTHRDFYMLYFSIYLFSGLRETSETEI